MAEVYLDRMQNYEVGVILEAIDEMLVEEDRPTSKPTVGRVLEVCRAVAVRKNVPTSHGQSPRETLIAEFVEFGEIGTTHTDGGVDYRICAIGLEVPRGNVAGHRPGTRLWSSYTDDQLWHIRNNLRFLHTKDEIDQPRMSLRQYLEWRESRGERIEAGCLGLIRAAQSAKSERPDQDGDGFRDMEGKR